MSERSKRGWQNVAGKYDELARSVIDGVGGKDNVMSVSHCITRLRFKLKDVGRADTGTLEKTKGVITVINANGQYQVVVGNDVVNIYDAVLAVGGLEGAGETDLDGNPLPEGGEKRKSEGPASVSHRPHLRHHPAGAADALRARHP